VSLSDELAAEVGDVKAKPGPKKAKGVNYAGVSMFDAVNLTPIVEVLDWLGIEHDGKAVKCPHCGNGFPCDTSCAIVIAGVKCSHDSCAPAGPPGFPGFRTGVDLTMLVHGVEKIEAVKMMAARFGVDLPSRNASSNDQGGVIRPLWNGGPAEEHQQQQEEKQAAKKPLTFKDIVDGWRQEGTLDRIDTGIHTLDTLCRGGLLIPRRVVLVGAPSAGKTYVETFLANRFLTVLAELGFLIGIIAVDEDPSDITARFAQMRGFSRDELEARKPETMDEVETTLSDAPVRLYDYEWLIDEAVTDLADWCKETGRRGVLFVDSIHTVRCAASELAKSPREVIESNLKALKLANVRHGFTVICTSEMNRSGYANAELAEKANAMALGAETRAIEFWAQLQITLQTPKDFPHIIHCKVSKNRGADKGEFWLELDHERHGMTECGNPDENPVNVQAKEERKLDGKNRKNLADANQLGKFILTHPGLSKRKLRTAVGADPSLGWGSGRLDTALAVLEHDQTIYRLAVGKDGVSDLYNVTLESGVFDA